MINKIKKVTRKFVKIICNILIKINFFRFILFQIREEVGSFHIKVNNSNLKFYVTNYLLKYRVDTFFEKEPQTIRWIDSFKKNKIFYDIGSNIGLYSCYAATKDLKVVSFEPSIFNLEILGKNIKLNNLCNNVIIVPISLNNKNLISKFNLSSIDNGSALSSFGEPISHDGSSLEVKFNYQTIGIKLDDCVNLFQLPYPDYIKIDVDGIEHLILEGSNNVLKNVTSILVEINDRFIEQKVRCEQLLKNNNFYLLSRENTDLSGFDEFESSYNQIWVKK
jgi:FkbM family methyltransferase